MKKTDDEKFLLKAYEIAQQSGDLSNEINIKAISQATGQKEKKIKAMIKLLSRSNFIKKIDNNTLVLTVRAIELVKQLKGD